MTEPRAAGSVLVIKLSALGDVVLALGPLAAIRRHHPAARLVVLTTPAYRTLIEASGLADAVWIDPRAGALSRPLAWWRLIRRIARTRFDRVYDLQTSGRTTAYFRALRAMGAAPPWSGIAPGCAFRHDTPQRTRLHTLERQAEQLRLAGLPGSAVPDLSFTWSGPRAAEIDRLDLPDRIALLVPGGSAHRPEKRWPAACFGALAQALMAEGLTPVLLGTDAEAPAIAAIQARCPAAISLVGRTGLLDIPALGHRAALAVGNDTGPLHMIALAGCPTVALFSGASIPDKHRPRGPAVVWLRRAPLADLPVETVLEAATRVRVDPPTDPSFGSSAVIRN
ncbi:glycosyltransferase family 9 protein [Roseospira visakhapatnamensis]|uniref:ADP-heptose:LPS heptosyltransferase n=1 Tax=Roseospira visakhapatnamensis TaxID=390880 RepID=A0A7W6WBC2_9PROT|nr:glycosyltransferase family 9 protein [Roseospira visakhapatnamensis]MBB4267407.1 ADP-heptose:LPS heptosyltransferase [Roseospira visakhapatnamensis]